MDSCLSEFCTYLCYKAFWKRLLSFEVLKYMATIRHDFIFNGALLKKMSVWKYLSHLWFWWVRSDSHWTKRAVWSWPKSPLRFCFLGVDSMKWFECWCSLLTGNLHSFRRVYKKSDPDVIWTRNLLIWSQTRYRCATESADSLLT